MLILKICGLAAVFSVCTLWGFFKADTVKKRAEKLKGFLRGICSLAEKIRINEQEIEPIVRSCFKRELVYPENGTFIINESYLKPDDISLLRDFFSGIGMGDAEGEYRRAEAYSKLLENQYSYADKDCLSLCRLYKTLGALFGIFICIFLL